MSTQTFARFVVTGPVVDNGTWLRIPVQLNSVPAPVLASGDTLALSFRSPDGVTSVSAGYGLSGGGSGGSVSLAVDTAVVALKGELGAAHAATHSAGGSDPISPSSIGAAPATHKHSMSEISNVTIAPAGSPAVPYDVSLTYSYSSSSWVAMGIGRVGVGSQPMAGWPEGSVGWWLAGKASTSHKSTHATGGSDALGPSDIGAAPTQNPVFSGVTTVATGSAGAPSLVSSGDSDTGLFFPFADTVAIATKGVSRLRVGADGHVGIGKTGTCALDVNGPVATVGGSAQTPSLTFGGDLDTGIFSAGTNTLAVSTNGVERFQINAAGNARLGAVTTARATLDIQGSSDTVYPFVASNFASPSRPSLLLHNAAAVNGAAVGQAFFVHRADGETQVASIGAVSDPSTLYQPALVFTQRTSSGNQTERMRIAPGGNVGLGTTLPSARLDVNSDVIRLRVPKTPGATSTGNEGDLCWDAHFLYVCTAANTWRKSRLTVDGEGGASKVSELTDVSVAGSLASGHTLVFDAASSSWKADGRIGLATLGTQPSGGWPAGSIGLELLGKAATASPTFSGAATFSGTVGVGTSVHSAALTVNGSIRATSLTDGTTTKTVTEILAATQAPTAGTLQLGTQPAGGWPAGSLGAALSLKAATNSPALTGNVAISATSGVPLTVTNSGSGNSFVVNDASGDTTPFVVNADGRVGVGVASPLAELHVNGAIRAASLTDGTTTKTMAEILAGGGPAGRATHIDQKLTPNAGTAGTVGSLFWDDDFIYIRTSTAWKKAPLVNLAAPAGFASSQMHLTQQQYNALSPKDPNTLYIIID